MISEIQSKFNTPELQKDCKVLRRRIFLPQSKQSFDMAELGGKVIISSEIYEGCKDLILRIEKGNDVGMTLLKKGNPFSLRRFLKNGSDKIAYRIEKLNEMLEKNTADEDLFLTGF